MFLFEGFISYHFMKMRFCTLVTRYELINFTNLHIINNKMQRAWTSYLNYSNIYDEIYYLIRNWDK
jgi:hypothetical protein